MLGQNKLECLPMATFKASTITRVRLEPIRVDHITVTHIMITVDEIS
jgi:hypothetical protein